MNEVTDSRPEHYLWASYGTADAPVNRLPAVICPHCGAIVAAEWTGEHRRKLHADAS